MAVNWRINILIGIFAFVFSFFFSLLNNLWLTSLLRAAAGFVIFLLAGWMIQALWGIFSGGSNLAEKELELGSLEMAAGKESGPDDDEIEAKMAFQEVPLESLTKNKTDGATSPWTIEKGGDSQ